jgi:hypothetical protein
MTSVVMLNRGGRMLSRTTWTVRLPVALAAAAAALGTVMSSGATYAAAPPDPRLGDAARSAQATVAGAADLGTRAALATDELTFGDLDGDGKSDLAAIDSTGQLWVYPGKAVVYPGTGTRTKSYFSARFQAGAGWSAFTALVRHGDWNNDGKQDILARDPQGRLILYAGTGTRPAVVRNGLQVGTGWNAFLDIVGVGDANGDGFDDLMGRRNGALTIYYGTGNSQAPFQRTTATSGSGWNGDLLTTIGDWTGDGRTEFIFRNTSNEVRLYRSSASGFPANQSTVIFDPADGAYLADMVGMGNLTSDAVVGGQPVTQPLPDVVLTDTDGFLYVLAIDTEDDFDPLVGYGWRTYDIF